MTSPFCAVNACVKVRSRVHASCWRWRWRTRSLLLAVTLSFWSATHADTTNELWPELDLGFPIAGPVRMLLTQSSNRDADGGDKAEGASAAYIDYRITENFSVRAGYKYLQKLQVSTGARESVEHRAMFDFDYGWKLGHADTQLADRIRIDVRDIEGTTTYRFRNRLRYSHALQVRGVRFTPYASGEVYYDTKYDSVDRLQFRLGATLPTGPLVTWDFYLARQRDTQPSTQFIDALGVTLNLKY